MIRVTPVPAGTPRWHSRQPAPALAACAAPQGAPDSARSAHHRRLDCAEPVPLPTANQLACQRAPRRFVQEKNPTQSTAPHSANTVGQLARCVLRSCTTRTKLGAATGIHRCRIASTATRSIRREASRRRPARHSTGHSRWSERVRRLLPDGLHAIALGAAFRATVPFGFSAQPSAASAPRIRRRQGIPLDLRQGKETGTTQTWKRQNKPMNTV